MRSRPYVKRILEVVICLLITIQVGYSQDQVIIERIVSLQVQEDNFYRRGLFTSQISRKKGKKYVEDDNIFFTGLINYTLQSIKDSRPIDEQGYIDNVYRNSKPTFDFYSNRNNDVTYNFYQVHPEKPFPNIKLLSKWKRFRLADDLDDTSIIYLVKESSDSLNRLVKDRMIEQSFKKKKVKSTFKAYRKSKAYRTWFADKMKQDFDICVMSNALLFVFEKKLELDTIDLATIRLIRTMIEEGRHLKKEHLIAPHYQSSAIILYHVARLIDTANHPELNVLREKVIADIENGLLSAENTMEKTILLTSLYRLNKPHDFEISMDELSGDMANFHWFKANLAGGYRLWFRKLVGQSRWFNLSYRSEAYYWSLVLELQTLSGAEIVSEKGEERFLRSN